MNLKNKLEKVLATCLLLFNCTYYYIQPQHKIIEKVKIIERVIEKPKPISEPKYWYWQDQLGRVTKLGFEYYPCLGLKKQIKICYEKFFSKRRIDINQICFEQLIQEELKEITTKYGCENQLKKGQNIEFDPSFWKYLK
ncbi:MAG: hypothetical protein NZ889_01085 [Candidatus Pacearchaeota archaeon]|nr:hypothetical protein [Candidatus Pacearchaeota archaeon]